MSAKTFLLDMFERAGSSFGEQFLIVLVTAGSLTTLGGQQWAHAADVAGFTAAASVITTLLTVSIHLTGWADVLERVAKGALQGFAATMFAANVTPTLVHADWKAALASAVAMGSAVLIKALAASGSPLTIGASLLPAGPSRTAAESLATASAVPDTLDIGDLYPITPSAMGSSPAVGGFSLADFGKAVSAAANLSGVPARHLAP